MSVAIVRTDLIEPLGVLLAEVLGVAQVSAQAHFFDDLGADSMSMAQFCARARKAGLPKISMKDVYRNPDLASLAAAVSEAQTPQASTPLPTAFLLASVSAPQSGTVLASEAVPPPETPPQPKIAVRTSPPVGRLGHLLCGLVQLLFLTGEVFLAAVLGFRGAAAVPASNGPLAFWTAAVAFGAASIATLLVVPVAAKWLLVGRMRPETFPAWSGRYLRFWVARTMIAKNPIGHLMIGSPLYNVWLRALGAKVGAGAVILSRDVALAPDLFEIGAGAVLRKAVSARCYHAVGSTIRTGRVVIGAGAVVGDKSILDVDTELGVDAQLGHASALHPGQRVPAGQAWHGSPAAIGSVDFSGPQAVPNSAARRFRFAVMQLAAAVGVGLPLALAAFDGLAALTARLLGIGSWGHGSLTAAFVGRAALTSFVLLELAVLAGLLRVALLPRLLARGIESGRVYPLHGRADFLLRAIARTSNSKFFTDLLGDSSAIVGYLKLVGYRLNPVRQTGTNFGQRVAHDHPLLVSVGTGTVVADGLSIVNADYSASSFRVRPAAIGRDNFLGNHIAYPAGGHTGDDCLLATKVMVPLDGPVRSGVGLLGSPAFEIPRTVARDSDLAVADPAELRRLLAAKNRHNGTTIALYLFTRWVHLFAALVGIEAATPAARAGGAPMIGALGVLGAVLSLAWFVVVERCSARLAARRPQGVSIYDPVFWRHERYWKVRFEGWLPLLDGTAMKPVALRLLGARVGRRVLDDGAALPEPAFVSIGDGSALNAGAILQSHSQEDDAFKSDLISLGSGVSVGVGSLTHYGVTIDDGAVLSADSFLMKGEQVPTDSIWGGNPARELSSAANAATTHLEVAP